MQYQKSKGEILLGTHFRNGKHGSNSEKEEKKEKKVKKEKVKKSKRLGRKIIKFFAFILIVIISIFAPMYINEYYLLNTDGGKTEEKDVSNYTVEISEIPDMMGEHKVIGLLVIDKIDLQKNILEQTTDSSLKLSVTKFYGANLNENGNFCIAGYNYGNVFDRLNELELGDTFYIIDRAKAEKVYYKVCNKYLIDNSDLSFLNDTVQGNKEVTLITYNTDEVTRLVINAQEII